MKMHTTLPGMLLLGAAAVLGASGAQAACQLNSAGGQIQHIVYLQFDNTHFYRNNPNVPSDLEQMPNLLNFLKNNGTLMTNHHTPLISHTATDILDSLTGLYGDRMGQPVSNSFAYFDPNDATGNTIKFSSSFAYWNDPLYTVTATGKTVPLMINEKGVVPAAPWVPYTRAGCDVGQVAVANTVLENTYTSGNGADILTVFGAGSPEVTEANSSATLAQADFVGIGVHCGYNSALCSSPNAKSDILRNEAGGYKGYKALFGHKYVAQAISPSTPLTDINGNIINDGKGNNGFPGFDGMSAAVSLGYVAKMLESNVPVVYAYISDAHDKHSAPTGAYGPGEAGYVAALKDYDNAFGAFFNRLAADGIDKSNTLFVISTEEEDHFGGTTNPTPANCDGVNIPCVYNHTNYTGNIGEVNVNLSRLLNTEKGNTTPFSVHNDLAPTFYVKGNPAQTATTTRQLERDVASLVTYNPYKSATENLVDYMVEQSGMNMLHMVTSDAARTPNFVAFQKGDYYSTASGTSACGDSRGLYQYSDCVNIQSSFAWNHGGYQTEITKAWLGLVGPGVNNVGQDDTTWSDHADIRPTMLTLVGLQDTYKHDGRVIVEPLQDAAIPPALATSRADYVALGQAFKAINAPVGDLGLATIKVSHKAVVSNDAGDTTFNNLVSQINGWTATRNSLTQQMNALLSGAAFGGQTIDTTTANNLISQAQSLVTTVQAAAP